MGNLSQQISVTSLNYQCTPSASPFIYDQQPKLRQIAMRNLKLHGEFSQFQIEPNKSLLQKFRYSVLCSEDCGISSKQLQLITRTEFDDKWMQHVAKIREGIQNSENNLLILQKLMEFDWVWYISLVEFLYERKLEDMSEQQMKDVNPFCSYLRKMFANSSLTHSQTSKLINTIKLIESSDVFLLQNISAYEFSQIKRHLLDSQTYSIHEKSCAIFLKTESFTKIHSDVQIFSHIPHDLFQDSKIYDMAVAFADNLIIVSALDSYWAEQWVQELLNISDKQNQTIMGCSIREEQTKFNLMDSLCQKMKKKSTLNIFPKGTSLKTAKYTLYSLCSDRNPITVHHKAGLIATTLPFKEKYFKLGDKKVTNTNQKLPTQKHPYLHYAIGTDLIKYEFQC